MNTSISSIDTPTVICIFLYVWPNFVQKLFYCQTISVILGNRALSYKWVDRNACNTLQDPEKKNCGAQ